jgi:hypothetical protein
LKPATPGQIGNGESQQNLPQRRKDAKTPRSEDRKKARP